MERKITICLLYTVFIAACAQNAWAIKIEEAQRALQERYQLALVTTVSWPPKTDGTPTPAYPEDGFYGDDLSNASKAAELVADLAGKLSNNTFLNKFVANDDGNIEGLATIPVHNTTSIPPVTGITSSNYVEKFSILLGYLCKLKHISLQASQVEVISKQIGQGFPVFPTCSGVKACMSALYPAVPYGILHRVNTSCVVVSVEGVGISPIQVSETLSNSGAGFSADLLNTKGQIQADLSRYPSGSGVSYLKVGGKQNGVSNNPPVPADGAFHSFASATLGGIWESEVLGSVNAVYSGADCPGVGGQFATGWQINDQVVIVTPDFARKLSSCSATEECTTCSNGICYAGSRSSATKGSALATFSLGQASDGETAGQVSFDIEKPSASNATPNVLATAATEGQSQIIRTSDGVLRQVLAPQALADIVVLSDFAYDIRFYHREQVGAEPDPTTGLYSVSGDPYTIGTIENPNASSDDVNTLRITETTASSSSVDEFLWSGDNAEILELSSGGGLRRESRSSVTDPVTNDRVETFIVTNLDNSVAYKAVTTFHVFPWGEEPIQKVVDPDGAALTTTWSYYEDAASSGYRHVQQVVQPTGYWERYEYDQFGRTTKLVAQYLDAIPGALETESRVTTTTYGDADPAVTVVEKLLGQEVSRRYIINRPGETREIQAHTAGAAWDDPSNLVTITKTYLGTEFEGDLQSVTQPNGTMSFYTYSRDGAGNKTAVVETGEPNTEGTAIVAGTRTVTVTDPTGNVRSEITYDIAAGLLVTSATTTQQDELGRPTRVEYNDGTFTTTTYGCCGVGSTTDREGITTTLGYDALKRVTSTSRAGITTLTAYDAEGRALSAIRQGSDQSQILLNSATYDASGRQTSSKDGLERQTLFREVIDDAGHTVKTTTFPDETTRVDIFAKDGHLLSLSGTAVHPVRNEYGVEAEGVFTKEIRIGDGGAETEWVKTLTDVLERPYKTVFPDGAASQSFFNSKGQLVQQTDPDGVMTLFAYNGKGEQESAAIDIDQDGVIDSAGSDRITRTQSLVTTAHGTTVRQATTSVWATEGVDLPTAVSINEISADVLQSWNTAFGLTTHTQTTIPGDGSRTVLVTAPDGTTTTSNFQDGRFISSVTQHSDSGILSSVSLSYDPHARQKTATDARGMVTTTAYDDADQVTSVTVAGAGGESQTTSYTYDLRGRRDLATLPDAGQVDYQYFGTGELKKISGARTYTAEYGFDSQGRIKTLTAGTGTTTWNYSPERAFLTSKIYADGKGPAYNYTLAGHLKTRTLARGVATTYLYTTAGDPQSIDYSDGTPDVAYTYDRQGRPVRISGGIETLATTYNDADQPLTETHTGGPLDGLSVGKSYDTFLRKSQLGVSRADASLLSSSLGYDSASRLQTVSDGAHVAEYGYIPNSSLVNTLSFKTGGATLMTTSRQYDGLNRLTSIASTPSADTASSFTYAYNQANQRTRVDLAGGSFWIYEYDGLGQVTSGKKFFSDGSEVPGQQFGYGFDDIGNRLSAQVDNRVSTYTPTALNQYTDRTVPGAIDITGAAASDATVTVNNQPVTRKADFFHTALSVDNVVSAVFEPVTVVGVKNNLGPSGEDVVTEETGNAFVPKTPEPYAYDADGNLTSDGRWNYTWDAENRLIAMESIAGIPVAAKKRLEFVYDYRGRRIQKKAYNWNGSSYVLSITTKFVYDGTHCIAELDGNGALVRSYIWGNDLSGFYNGAGGVGGLLAVTDATQGTHFATMDGNGNVAGLVDASTGKLSAEYDYNPFGELIRATGPMAKVNPYQFSTKHTDQETGLVLYPMGRWHNPSTGRWLSRDPLEEDGGLNLYGMVGNDPINDFDPFGLAGNGHHVFPQSLSEGMAEEVRKFFDRDMNRIFNDYYKSHGAEKLEGISAKKYNQLVSEELEKFLGKQAIKNMTVKQAEAFMSQLNNLPSTSEISIYNNAVRRAALKAEMTKAAERAAAISLARVEAAGAKKVGGKKLAKAIPLIGTVVAVYFIFEDAQVYGYGPAIVSGGIDAIPLVGTGKIGSEIIAGGRWLDVTVGPKEVKPSETDCPGSDQ